MKPKLKMYIHVPFDHTALSDFFRNGVLEIISIHEVGDGINHVAVVVPKVWEFKELFGSQTGVTILPSVFDLTPLSDDHVAKLAHAGVVKGETMRQAAHKLRAHHGHASLDPDLF